MEDLISQVLGSGGLGDVSEVLDGLADGQLLRDLDDASVMEPTAEPLVGEPQHGVHVVGQQDAILAGRPVEDVEVVG